MRWVYIVLFISVSHAQEMVDIELKLDTKSFFTDMMVTAVAKFPETVSEPVDFPKSEISIVNLEVSGSTVSDTESVATISFLPGKTGLITVPALDFAGEAKVYRTKPVQILVSSPSESEAMAFSMVPVKTKVYTGEPLRIDVTWKADFPSNQIRSLQCFPAVFSRQDAKIVIPRCTAPEGDQIGLPFGGRRIAAQREIPVKADGKPSGEFGTVTFPVFVKFTEPGEIELPETRLEIARLKGTGGALAPYAVFFNNGLFEPRTALEAFERFYTKSNAVTIEVLPLPQEGQSENFSGLFAPCEIEASLKNSQLNVGEVIEVDLRVRSEAPHGMLELPPLGLQRSLRGRFRAGAEYGRTWYEDGTGFLGRVRALTTDIYSLPSLQFQIFDPATGKYIVQQTEAIPLTVAPTDGKHYFDIRSLAPEATFTEQPAGVWQNAQSNPMRDLFNSIINLLAEHFYLWLLLGPVVFFCLLPRVKERRRRAIDPVYQSQAEAYEVFSKLPEQTEGKWEAFRTFLGTGFSIPGNAWTPGDAADRLREIGVEDADIEQVVATHKKMDAADFSTGKRQARLPELNDLGRRLFDHFRNALIAVAILLPCLTVASDWEEAEVLFSRAVDAPAGLPETESLFTRAAMKFEAAAAAKIRPGASWFNAGNAWFKAGEMGRAISCFRQAQIYRPFDPAIKDNLSAARALCLDVVEDTGGLTLRAIPVRWLAAILVWVCWLLVAVLLLHFRYRTRTSLAGVTVAAVLLLGICLITSNAARHSKSEGVVIVSSIYGRKGPAYSYEKAFNEPLHDGLEFTVKEERKNWLFVSLADERKCWIPADQARRINNER